MELFLIVLVVALTWYGYHLYKDAKKDVEVASPTTTEPIQETKAETQPATVVEQASAPAPGWAPGQGG